MSELIKKIEEMRVKRALNSRTASLMADVIAAEGKTTIPDDRKRNGIIALIKGLNKETDGYMEALDTIVTLIENGANSGKD